METACNPSFCLNLGPRSHQGSGRKRQSCHFCLAARSAGGLSFCKATRCQDAPHHTILTHVRLIQFKKPGYGQGLLWNPGHWQGCKPGRTDFVTCAICPFLISVPESPELESCILAPPGHVGVRLNDHTSVRNVLADLGTPLLQLAPGRYQESVSWSASRRCGLCVAGVLWTKVPKGCPEVASGQKPGCKLHKRHKRQTSSEKISLN